MKIAIVGGGFTGLTSAYTLAKQGLQVTVYEKEPFLGGLAVGLRQPGWDWTLEKGYHHLFTNDSSIIGLMDELGLSDKLIIKRPVTSNYTPIGKIVQFDRPQDLLTYPDFTWMDKFRTALLLSFLKVNPIWKPLEGLTAKQLFIAIGGTNPWKTMWEPLMLGKFGGLAKTVAASWMWARINKRTPSLAYIDGGFQTLIDTLAVNITGFAGEISAGKTVSQIQILKNGRFQIGTQSFDKVLLTIPTPVITKLIPELQNKLLNPLSVPHLHAQTLILETREPILKDTYWLSVLDRTFPFLAVVAHTNFMDPKHYGGHHLTYFGNYLPTGHRYLSMTKEQLLKEFLPFIKRLNPILDTRYLILNTYSFVGPFAQPVHQLHYSRIAPKFRTSIRNLYIANLDSIYPWDRGTNYAVELGYKAADILKDS